MNRKILLMVLALAVVLVATPYIGTTYATPSTPVSGTFSVTVIASTVTTRTAGTNVFVYREALGAWTGGIAGSTHGYQNIVLHGATAPAVFEFSTAQIDVYFVLATVGGKTGALHIQLISKGEFGGVTGGTWRIIEGEGPLTSIHGGGTWQINVIGSPASYGGEIHFDP